MEVQDLPLNQESCFEKTQQSNKLQIPTITAVLDFYVEIFLKIILPNSVFDLVTNHCYMHMPTITTLQICWHNPISFHHYFLQTFDKQYSWVKNTMKK